MNEKYLFIWKIDISQIKLLDYLSIFHKLFYINVRGILFGLKLASTRVYTVTTGEGLSKQLLVFACVPVP